MKSVTKFLLSIQQCNCGIKL